MNSNALAGGRGLKLFLISVVIRMEYVLFFATLTSMFGSRVQTLQVWAALAFQSVLQDVEFLSDGFSVVREGQIAA